MKTDKSEYREHWSMPSEIWPIVTDPPRLRRCIGIAAVVGTILFLINQADIVFSGGGTPLVWLKVGLTYLVPFFVANYGILVVTHRPRIA